jgi:DNA-binding NarL/FixJ family response regulator
MSIRILLVDDHKLFLAGLRGVLKAEPDMEVIAEASDGRSAVKAARKERPDVVVMDLSMPDMNGVEATRQITAELAGVKVLCLSMHSEEQLVEAALKAGATGYVLKDCDVEELIRAVRALAANGVYLSPAIGATVLEAYKRGESGDEVSAFSLLTPREREVLQLIAEGHSTPEIAERLGLSGKTVGTYREHLMEKLDIHSVAGLTKYAIRAGLTSSTG